MQEFGTIVIDNDKIDQFKTALLLQDVQTDVPNRLIESFGSRLFYSGQIIHYINEINIQSH